MIQKPIDHEWLNNRLKEIRVAVRTMETVLDQVQSVEALILRSIELTYQNRTRFGTRRAIRTLLRQRTYKPEYLVNAVLKIIETKAKKPRATVRCAIRQMIVEGRISRIDGRLELRREV